MTLKHDNIDDIIKNFVYPVPLAGDQNLPKLLGVLASENRRIDLEVESLYDNRFVESASGRELEKLAFEVGTRRKTDEIDDSLRRRVFGSYAAQSSDTSYDNFATAALQTLGADPAEIELTTPPDTTNPKTVELRVDGSRLDTVPLTDSEIVTLLERANSAGATVEVTASGTFAFAGDDTSLKGWDDGTWSNIIE